MAEENNTGPMQVDIELVRQLAAVLDETQLTEIEVQDGERKVRVVRSVTAAPAYQMAAAPAATFWPTDTNGLASGSDAR